MRCIGVRFPVMTVYPGQARMRARLATLPAGVRVVAGWAYPRVIWAAGVVLLVGARVVGRETQLRAFAADVVAADLERARR